MSKSLQKPGRKLSQKSMLPSDLTGASSLLLEQLPRGNQPSAIGAKIKEDLEYVVKDLKIHGYLRPSNPQLLGTPEAQRQIARLVERITAGKLNLQNDESQSEKNLGQKQKTQKVVRMDKTAKQEDGVVQEEPNPISRTTPSPNRVQIVRNVTKKKLKSRSKQRKQNDLSEPCAATSKSETGGLKQDSTREKDDGQASKKSTCITVTKRAKSPKARKVKKQAQKEQVQVADADIETGTAETARVPKAESVSELTDGASTAKSARMSKLARFNQRIAELSKPRNPKTKPNSRKSRKAKEVRPSPEVDYVRFLLRDPNAKITKKNSLKAISLGLTLSDSRISSQPNSPTAKQAGKSGPKPLSPSAGRPIGRFELLVGTDKQKLDTADTIIVGNAETFVDFARVNKVGEVKKQRSPTLLQRLSQVPASKTSKAELSKGKFRAEVKLPGIQNQNISLEFAGNVLIVIAYRPKDKKHNARKITELVEIPADVNVNNLRIGRRPNGAIWIEEWIADSEEDLKREKNFYLNEEYSSKSQSIAVAIVEDIDGQRKVAATNKFSLGNL